MNMQYANFKCGFVAIIGRPSVGKSTFLNTVCGESTAITSSFPQTTRNIIKGIVTRESFQIVFLDTPGIHESQTKLGIQLSSHAKTAIKDSEAVLYMLDATRAPGEEETRIIDILSKTDVPIFTCINKMDIERPEIVHSYLELLRNSIKDKIHECLFISAQETTNTESLLETISTVLPTQAPYYESDYYTDQTPEFRIKEQVRSAALEYLNEEIPHALYTEILEISVKHTKHDGSPNHVYARVQLVVERESQLAIVVGKGGSMIKKIRLLASKRIQTLFDYNVQLELRVIVKKKWRKNNTILSNL